MAQRYYSDTHIFTSRSTNPNITLKAGAGETLMLEGQLSGNLITTKTSTQLGQKTGTLVNNLVTVPVGTSQSNGLSPQMSKDNRLIFMAEYPVVGPAVTGQYINVFVRSGNTYASEALIDIPNISYLDSRVGPTCCIEKTGSKYLGFNSNTSLIGNDDFQIYSRSGSTWTHQTTLTTENIMTARIDGDYMICGKKLGSVTIMHYSAGWTTTSTLQTDIAGAQTIKYVDIDSATVCYVDDRCQQVKVYKTNGTYVCVLDKLVVDSPIQSLSLYGNTIVYSTAENIYICARPLEANPFAHVMTIPIAGVVSVCVNSDSYFYAVSATTVYFFTKNLDWNNYTTQTTTAIDFITADANGYVLGKPTASSGLGSAQYYSLTDVSPATNTTTSTIDVSDQVTISSIYPVVINPELHLQSDLRVVGVAYLPNQHTIFTTIIGSTAQSTAKDVDVLLAGVYANDTNGTQSDELTFDYSTGKITILESGVYSIFGDCTFAQNNTGIRGLHIYKNGSLLKAFDRDANNNTTTTGQISILCKLAANDYIQLYSYQTSAGALNVTQATFTVLRMGI